MRTRQVAVQIVSGLPLAWLLGCGAQSEVPQDGMDEPSAEGKADAPSEPSGCFAVELEDGQPMTLPGAVSLGDFTVAVDAQGGLDVSHAEAGGRSLFATPPTRPWLTAARTTLDAEERQGSFDVEADVHERCSEAQVDDVRTADGALVLAGGFADGGACGSLRWQVQLCEARPGHLAFRVTTDDPSFNHLSLATRSEADERIYGMGEQFPHDTLDLKGRQIPVLSQEGGIGRGHPVITPAVNLASPGSGGSERSTYYAAPHYLTSALRSLMLENPDYALFDFRDDDAIEIELFAPEMTGRILYGDSPLQLIERFTEYAGRMPPLPAWVHDGAIVALARDLDESRAIVDELRARGAEIAAVWNQTWSGKAQTWFGEQVLWNWAQNPAFHPGWSTFVSDLEARGIRTLCYINPMLVDPPAEAGPVARNLYQEALEGGYFVRDAAGDVYHIQVTAFDVGLIDLTHPEARLWIKDVITDELLEGAGCSGWMVDFAEALPFDAQLHGGESAQRFHNEFPVEWIRVNREAIEEAGALGEVLLFNRAGSTRTPSYATLLWQGDQLITWDKYDGLVSALHGLISGGFSGIALNHSDTGGYTSLSALELGFVRERELLARWTEMNAFTAVLRTHEGNQPGANAQVYDDEETMDHFARFTKVYKALGFYRKQLVEEAATRGWPVVRHLWMQYPDDERAQTVDDQFMLGSEILVAPIKNKCWTRPWCPYNKTLYLPAGEWVHLWSGDVHAGGREVTVRAPIGEPAVFYRRGSSIASQLVANLRAAGIGVADAR